jgi:hypothetical protein
LRSRRRKKDGMVTMRYKEPKAILKAVLSLCMDGALNDSHMKIVADLGDTSEGLLPKHGLDRIAEI